MQLCFTTESGGRQVVGLEGGNVKWQLRPTTGGTALLHLLATATAPTPADPEDNTQPNPLKGNKVLFPICCLSALFFERIFLRTPSSVDCGVFPGKAGLICSIGCCYTVPRRHILRHVKREGKAALIGREGMACCDWWRGRTGPVKGWEQSIHTKVGPPLTCRVRHQPMI